MGWHVAQNIMSNLKGVWAEPVSERCSAGLLMSEIIGGID